MEELKGVILNNLVEQISQLQKQSLQESIKDEPNKEALLELDAMSRALNWCVGLVKDAYKAVLKSHQNIGDAEKAAPVEAVEAAEPVETEEK